MHNAHFFFKKNNLIHGKTKSDKKNVNRILCGWNGVMLMAHQINRCKVRLACLRTNTRTINMLQCCLWCQYNWLYPQHPRILTDWIFISVTVPSKEEKKPSLLNWELKKGLFINILIVLLIRKVFMHFSLPSLTLRFFPSHSLPSNLLISISFILKRANVPSTALYESQTANKDGNCSILFIFKQKKE